MNLESTADKVLDLQRRLISAHLIDKAEKVAIAWNGILNEVDRRLPIGDNYFTSLWVGDMTYYNRRRVMCEWLYREQIAPFELDFDIKT